jgi:hypothetical protein
MKLAKVGTRHTVAKMTKRIDWRVGKSTVGRK